MAIAQSDICVICSEHLNHYLSIKQLFIFRPLTFPILCQTCQSKFKLLVTQADDCKGCGRPLDASSKDVFLKPIVISQQAYCFDCANWHKNTPSQLISHQALFDYNEAMQEWIVNYKYHGDVRMAAILSPYLKEVYEKYKEYQWVVLPSSPSSLKTRQFHPTAYLLDVADIPYQVPFDYIGDGVKQAKKSKKERLNLNNTFKIKEEALDLSKENWLIFDDIYTTGATLIHAKKILYQFYKERDRIIRLISVSVARDQLSK